MAVMKTPGVYIVEKNAFPNSVVEVATAVPAFIGYTKIATNAGTPLTNKPFRIGSMAEFERYFGGPPPATFEIAPLADGEDPLTADFSVQSQDGSEKKFTLGLAKTTPQFRLYYSMKHFFQNGGGPCYIVSVGDYSAAPAKDQLAAGVKKLELEQEPTMVVVPDAVELDDAGKCYNLQADILLHCGYAMKNRVAILDVYDGDKEDTDGSIIANFRSGIGINELKFGAAYYPWVHTTLVSETDLTYEDFVGKGVKIPDVLADVKGGLPPAFEPVLDDMKLSDEQWAAKADADWDAKDPKPNAQAKAEWDGGGKADWIDIRKRQTNQALYQASPLFVTILKAATRKLNLMPPSAAMAGIYTMVDNSRGVWKAPANVSINGVTAPAVSISAVDQQDLNVHAQGKSINAIRSFIGEGVLVWGARTLDGNSLDWRYVNVRRTMIMLEESCRLAAKAMVFEPNVAGTWLTIKSMIQNFLTGIWKRGGLAGSVPEDAFSVHCGLGETMTSEDILEGILKVTVLVAISRPAEFIEITFQQQMQKS